MTGAGYTADTAQWRLDAACRGHPHPEWWSVATPGNTDGQEDNRRAVAICDSCPVAAQCLDFGVGSGSVGVIYGGHPLITPGKRRSGFCPGCGAAFVSAYRYQRYCTTVCGERHRRARRPLAVGGRGKAAAS